MAPNFKPKLDGFEFLNLLGKGSFGEVWLAFDLNLQVPRAVKILPKMLLPQREAQRLIAEARKMAQLPRHRHRVEVHHLKDGITNCFLVMDYVAGGALGRQIASGQPLAWGRAARYVASVGDALIDLHARGLLHRDIKPDNILWDPERDEAVLGDFGLAIAAEQAARGAGTRGYVAPEAYTGPPTAKSDVFSLAATLYHLVAGRRPQQKSAPTHSPGWLQLPGELHSVLRAGLAPDPAQRPDLPTFLGLLREARWKALTDRILQTCPKTPGPIGLQAMVGVSRPDAPTVFRQHLQSGGSPRPAVTGDFVKLEAKANADGYHTVLLLGSSGELEIGLPCATEPNNHFGAGQHYSLIFQLTPPSGTDRILIHWSPNEVRRDRFEWRRWLEQAGLAENDPRPAAKLIALRGMDLIRFKLSPAPAVSGRIFVISVAHAGAM